MAAPVPSESSQPVRGPGFYLRGVWLFFKRMWPAIYDLSTSEAYVYASAIAFNALLSFYAFLVLLGNVLINWAKWQTGYETIYRMMILIAPKEAAPVITSLDVVTRSLGKGAGFYSIFALIFTCTGVFLPLELALNRAWGFKQVRGTIKQQLVYLPLVVVCGLVILLFVGLASLWGNALGVVVPFPGVRSVFFNLSAALFAVPCITLIFFLIYYWLPNGKVQFRRVFFSSAAMAVLWVLMTFVYRLLLPMLNFRSQYDNLFAVVTIITWMFISSFLLILGANLSAREILPRRFTDEAQLPAQARRSETAAPVATSQ